MNLPLFVAFVDLKWKRSLLMVWSIAARMNYKSIGKHWKTSLGIPGEYQSGACSLQLSTSAITSHKSNATHCHIGLVVPTCSFHILPIQMECLHMITHASVKKKTSSTPVPKWFRSNYLIFFAYLTHSHTISLLAAWATHEDFKDFSPLPLVHILRRACGICKITVSTFV